MTDQCNNPHTPRSWWQRVVQWLRLRWQPKTPANTAPSVSTTAPPSAWDLGVVSHTPMGSMMSDLQRQSEAVRVAAEQTRALLRQVRRDADAGTQRLRAQRHHEPPVQGQDALQVLAEQVRELRERVQQSEERLESLMAEQTSQQPAGRETAPKPALVSEGQLTSHPILRHARAANH